MEKRCIVCKQLIGQTYVDTVDGPVHNGQCLSYYAEKKSSLNESTSMGEVLEEVQLL